MSRTIRPGRPVFALLGSLAFFVAAGVGAAPAAQPVSLDGTITMVGSTSFSVSSTSGGGKLVTIAGDTLILDRQTATMEDLKPGMPMGVAARRGPDGSLTATSINVFSPELWSKVRKGQWPMESGEVMTNAVVTNAAAQTVDGRTLTMSYEDVSATILVPPGVDIHRILTVRPADLKSGMHVTVRGLPDANGGVTASIVSFDADGKTS
jgi:hypothetical protein